MNKKSFVFATFLALSTLLTSNAAFAQSVQATTMPAPYQNYYEFNSDCNLGTRTLKVGSKGEYVWTLESLINLDRGLRGLPELIADGNYNSLTKNAVRDMQEGFLDLDGTGIVDSETREAFTDFCYQYVGRNVPRVIQYNDWNYNNRDQVFIDKFNNEDFSQYGVNFIKNGKVFVIENGNVPATCSLNDYYCNQEQGLLLGVKVESISEQKNWCMMGHCDPGVVTKFTFVRINQNGKIVDRETVTVPSWKYVTVFNGRYNIFVFKLHGNIAVTVGDNYRVIHMPIAI